MIGNLPTRFPWPPEFPAVVVHADLERRDLHSDYAAAKAGDAAAALRLAVQLLSDDACRLLQNIVRPQPVKLLPVVADEFAGFNAIPDAMAQVLAQRLGLEAVSGNIVQSNKVGHTRAKSFQRIVTPAEFRGEVEEGVDYLLVDDHVGLGGTLANLRGFVEGQGGRVVGMTTLSMSTSAQQISLTDPTRDALWRTHGQALDFFWQSEFGHGIDCLTQLEGALLCRQPSVAAIENKLASATVEARGRNLGVSSNESGIKQ